MSDQTHNRAVWQQLANINQDASILSSWVQSYVRWGKEEIFLCDKWKRLKSWNVLSFSPASIHCDNPKDSFFQVACNSTSMVSLSMCTVCESVGRRGVKHWHPGARKRPSLPSQQPSPAFLLTCCSLTATCRPTPQLDSPPAYLGNISSWPPPEPVNDRLLYPYHYIPTWPRYF